MDRRHGSQVNRSLGRFVKRGASVAIVCLALTAASQRALAQTSCGTAATPIPPFGEVGVLALQFNAALSVGLTSHHVVGKSASWATLQPDGVNFDNTKLQDLDREVKEAVADGMTAIELRVRPGGGGSEPFAGAQSTWPVDLSSYDYKDGEWLGPRNGPALEAAASFPPKVLTRDTAGNTSPWYEFIKALAARYSGCTPDPDPLFPNSYLPRVDYWSTVHEADSKGFWYGTSKDMFGGVGGDLAVGLQPSFYRAVKAGNPNAKVTSGGASSQGIGYYMAFERAQQAGNQYTQAVRNWGKGFFHTSLLLQVVFDQYPGNDAGLYQHLADEPTEIRSRTIIDAMFTPSANAYYDILGAHFYDNPLMLEDFVAFLDARQVVRKPIWLSELGFANQSSTFNADDQGRWLVQKLVVAMATGVEHVTYSPLMASLMAPTFVPLFDGTPGAPTWRPAAYSAKLVADAIGAGKGYSFLQKRGEAGGDFYEFQQTTGNGHLAFAWHPATTTTVDLRQLFGIDATTPIDVYDYKGTQLWNKSTQTTYTVTTSPVLVRWAGSSTIGCTVDRGAPATSGLENLVLLVAPLAWAAWRRRSARPAALPILA